MHRLKFNRPLLALMAIAGSFAATDAIGAVPNALILNEANTVSGSKFLSNGYGDTAFGRVEGNGQNWLEFLVVQGDSKEGGGFKNTLDLRGWTMHWSYDKDNLHASVGSGDIQFTNDPLWAAVPRGTMITISEWHDAWYLTNTPTNYDPLHAGGLQRIGGYNGLGHLRGVAYNAGLYSKLGATSPGQDPQLFATNTYWNPAANGGGANGDWNIHVFAGEQNPDTTFKYFNFSGSVTTSQGTYPIGTDDGGLFTANNDNWQYTIKDQQSNIIQGPFGEQDTGLGSTWRVSSTEILRLEGRCDDHVSQSTQSLYLDATIADYADGSESTFGSANVWSAAAGHQGLQGLRNWLQMGDADLDGAVTAADYTIWRKHMGTAGGWMQGDFSGNGIVDSADYDIWRANFGVTLPGSGAGLAEVTIPEPHTCTLFAIGTMILATRRRTSSHAKARRRNGRGTLISPNEIISEN